MTVFVGRTAELERLGKRLDAALSGRGGVVFITGEAGAGKSSLTDRFLVDAALRAPEARVVGGACSEQYGAGEPYQPFVEAFRDLLSEPEKRAGKVRLRDMARQLAPFWLSAIPVAGDLVAATMATAVELKKTMGGTAAATATATSEEALFFQYTELLLAAAAEYPIVLFIDDLHWADRASVFLLGHIGRKVVDKPVLIIGTYRADDVEVSGHPIKKARLELERYGVAEQIELTALDSSALAEFVSEELGGLVSPELIQWLERRAGTNPLFFGELLKWLVEQEYVQLHHSEWVMKTPPEEVEIPRSAESTIEKRLTRLDPDSYRVLEYASVEGDEFESTVLARLLDVDELELEEQLEPLVRVHKLVRLTETRDLPDGDVTSVYQFGHTLTQDVLHSNLQGKRRILLHRKIAQILEEIYSSGTDLIANKLAVHYDEGRQADRAFDFALRAAERAGQVYAHYDALELLGRALRNTQSDEQKADVLERLGEENRSIGRYAEALTEFQEAIDMVEAFGDSIRGLRLKRRRVAAERDFGNRSPEELYADLEALVQEARSLEAKAELCEILLGFRALPEPAPHQPREALQIAEALGEPGLVAKAHYNLGTVLMFGESPPEAIPHLTEAREFYTQQGDKGKVGLCHNTLAIVHVLSGEYREAIEEFAAAATAFDDVGDPVNEAAVRNNLGTLLIRTGELARAEENLQEAIRILHRLDATARLLHPLENMAELFKAQGDDDAAAVQWRELLGRAHDMGYWTSEIVARCALGMQAIEGGDVDEARSELDEVGKLLSQNQQDEWSEVNESVQMLTARLRAAEGELAAAIEALQPAEEALASRDRYVWAKFRLEHGELLSRDEPGAAEPIIREALAVFEKLGAKPMIERAESTLTRAGSGS